VPAHRRRERTSGRVALSFVGGLALLIVGLALHAHYGPLNALCASPVGAIGQAVVPNGQTQCGLANTWLTLGDLMAWVGGFVMVGAAFGAYTLRNRTQSGTGWRDIDVRDDRTQSGTGWRDIDLSDES
jgi:hypothetical protein